MNAPHSLVHEPLRLLVVDDNRAIHEDFHKVLGPEQNVSADFSDAEASLFGGATDAASGQKSFEFDSAFQGEDALELVQRSLAAGRRYPVAFMDVRMPPGWDGIETTAKIW